MLDKSSKIALVLPSQGDIDLFSRAFGSLNFRKLTAFTSGREAYEVVIRQQFDIFVVAMDMPEMSGVVFVQKIRETGNYGNESQLFVCKKIEPPILNILHELDISHVMTSTTKPAMISEKINHLIKSENNLSDYEKNYRDARSALFNGLVEMALEMAEKLVSTENASEKAYILLGDISNKRGNTDEMINHYAQALKLNPKSAVAAHKLAGAYLQKGESKRAADMYNMLARLNPYNLKLLENAGLSNYNVQDYDKAQAYASELKSLDHKNKSASELTVNIKLAKGDFEGLADALKGSHDDKDIVSFLNNAGVKLAQGNDAAGALRMYQSCIQQLTGSKYIHAVYFNMGIAYKKMNQIDKAIECYEKAVKIRPDFAKAAASLAELKNRKAS